MTDSGYALFPSLVTAQDLDLDSKKEYGHIGFGQSGEANGVFLCSYDHLEIAANATIDEAKQLSFAITVMIVARLATSVS